MHDAAGRDRLEPLTLTITGENPDCSGQVVGSASFLCFPFFDQESPPQEQTEANGLAKPSNFLCQIRLNLGYLARQGRKRDAGSRTESNAGFFVSQIWALIINDSMSWSTAKLEMPTDSTKLDTLVTCASGRATSLCEGSIQIDLDAQARLDEEAWPIKLRILGDLHRTIPVRHCKTWFVSSISQTIAV